MLNIAHQWSIEEKEGDAWIDDESTSRYHPTTVERHPQLIIGIQLLTGIKSCASFKVTCLLQDWPRDGCHDDDEDE